MSEIPEEIASEIERVMQAAAAGAKTAARDRTRPPLAWQTLETTDMYVIRSVFDRDGDLCLQMLSADRSAPSGQIWISHGPPLDALRALLARAPEAPPA